MTCSPSPATLHTYFFSLIHNLLYCLFWMPTAISAQHVPRHLVLLASSPSLSFQDHIQTQLQTVSLLSQCIQDFSFFCQSSRAHSSPLHCRSPDPITCLPSCSSSSISSSICRGLLTARLRYHSVQPLLLLPECLTSSCWYPAHQPILLS